MTAKPTLPATSLHGLLAARPADWAERGVPPGEVGTPGNCRACLCNSSQLREWRPGAAKLNDFSRESTNLDFYVQSPNF